MGLGTLYGLPYYESLYAGTMHTIHIKIQTRKFTNKRWCKKYKKKYTFKQFVPGIFKDFVNNCLFIHPDTIQQLKMEGKL